MADCVTEPSARRHRAVNAGPRPRPAVESGVLRTRRQQPGGGVEVRGQGAGRRDRELGLGVPVRVEDRRDSRAVPEHKAAQHGRRAGPAPQPPRALKGGEAALAGRGLGEPEHPGPEAAGPGAVIGPRPFAGPRIGEHREPPRRDPSGLLDPPQQARQRLRSHLTPPPAVAHAATADGSSDHSRRLRPFRHDLYSARRLPHLGWYRADYHNAGGEAN